MNKELAEWIVKAIETIKSGVADKLEKDNIKFFKGDKREMTREELEKEAEEYASENDICVCDEEYWSHNDIKQAYLASAEPREKHIAELELTNKRISDECHKLVDTLEKKQNENELLETQNIKLQAEVSRLTIKNAELIGKIAFTENDLNNAKAQWNKEHYQLAKARKHLKDLVYVVELGKNELATARILAEVKEFLKEE